MIYAGKGVPVVRLILRTHWTVLFYRESKSITRHILVVNTVINFVAEIAWQWIVLGLFVTNKLFETTRSAILGPLSITWIIPARLVVMNGTSVQQLAHHFWSRLRNREFRQKNTDCIWETSELFIVCFCSKIISDHWMNHTMSWLWFEEYYMRKGRCPS